MAAHSNKPNIKTDTLARILADQGHIDDARAMLNHLQMTAPKAERDQHLRDLDRAQRQKKVKRLERLLAHIRSQHEES